MLTDAINDLKGEMKDSDGALLLEEALLTRLLQRAIYPLCQSIDQHYQLLEQNVTPPMPGDVYELWLLRAKIMAYEILATRHAPRTSWTAGDTSMSSQAEVAKRFQELRDAARVTYQEGVEQLNPSSDPDVVDATLVASCGIRGIHPHHHHDHGSGRCR